MKKILKSKALAPALLSIACVGILAASLFIGKEEKTEFQPETPAPSAVAQEWQEPPAATAAPTAQPGLAASSQDKAPTTSTYANAQPKTTGSPVETYPKVAEETDTLVTIEFTPEAQELHPEPPEAPIAEGDVTNPEEPPVYAPEAVKPEPTAAPAQPDTPAAGSSNGNGAVYDPVFGWVVPGEIIQTPMDSAGDPNKMVGNM